MEKTYSASFYDILTDTSARSAAAVWPRVLSFAPITSAVDIGCGEGGWLAELMKLGVTDVYGVDGPWVAEDTVQLPKNLFARAPLEEPIALPRRFDLAVSLEVGEHLTPGRAPGFVADLVRLAPLVLFSAALPGQGGHNHINEQWPRYWADLFAEHGYRPVDCLRPQLMADRDVVWWYAQNMLFYASEEALARYPRLAAAAAFSTERPASLVHAEKFALLYAQAHPDFGQWLKMGSAALRRTLRGKRRTIDV